jgi:RND superfamily putative drug exporter
MDDRDQSLAAVVGGWSARHRRMTILGWLLFVVIVYAIGAATGQRQLTDVEMGNGQSKQASALYEKAFPFHSGEQVLVQGSGSIQAGDPRIKAAVP